VRQNTGDELPGDRANRLIRVRCRNDRQAGLVQQAEMDMHAVADSLRPTLRRKAGREPAAAGDLPGRLANDDRLIG